MLVKGATHLHGTHQLMLDVIYPVSCCFLFVSVLLTTKNSSTTQPDSNYKYDLVISMIYFPTIILTNIAVLIYMIRKLDLHHNPVQRWLQVSIVLAMTIELAYRISLKIGHESGGYSWTTNLYFCYVLFTLFNGIPYVVLTSILVLTLECLIISRRREDGYSGFSKKMMKILVTAIWATCLGWAGLEIYALGDGIYMDHDINTCRFQPESRWSSSVSFVVVTWLLTLLVASSTVALIAQLIRRPALGKSFLSIVLANCVLIVLDLPFYIFFTMYTFDVMHPAIARVKEYLWYGLYFIMKSSYLIVPLIWKLN